MTPFNSKYFATYPDHILGEVLTHNPNTGRLLTDAFQNPRPEVRGTLADALTRIAAPIVQRYNHENAGPATSTKEAKLAAVLKITEQEDQINTAQPKGKYVCGDGMTCLADSIRLYNLNVEYKLPDGSKATYDISDEEISAFVTYQVQQGIWKAETIRENAWGKYLNPDINWKKLFEADLAAYDGIKWVSASIFYAGNIYERIQEVQRRQEGIVREIGQEGYQRILRGLEAAKPNPLRFTTDPKGALLISPFDRIWDEFKFFEDTDGVPFDSPQSVTNVFKRWLRQLPGNQFTADNGKVTSNQLNVTEYWLDGRNFPRYTTLTEEQKVTVKRNATLVGQVLFERFCIEGLTRDQQMKIEYLFNSTHNHYAPVAYHRIPVGFEVSQKFKGGKLNVRSAQREGVAFLSHRGTGIVAYDVGVGKTATAILSIEDGFSKGFWKRPLVVTPNGVYWKWVAEITGVRAEKDIIREGKKVASKGDLIGEGILPHRKVNTFYNLGSNVAVPANGNGKAKTVEAGSITMLTYEGLEKIGFSQDSERDLVEKVLAALSQGESGRREALKEKAAEQWLDKALVNTEYDMEDFGFDAIIVDECHNFRVLFTEVKGDIDSDGEREVKHFQSGGSGQPSTRAVKLFLLNLYVQSKHGNRNTIGLSATPFTNRATEIYSMLAHFDYDGLAEFGVHNLAQFCKVFIDETSETVWTAAGKFDVRYVIRGYNNVPVLQSILFRSINYKTGEEANIQRPQKVVLPLNKDDRGLPLAPEYIIETRLPETADQAKWLKDAYLFASPDFGASEIFDTGLYPINDKTRKPDGQVLVALNVARVATFTPYAIALKGKFQYDLSKFTYRNIVEDSPKLLYTSKCIASVRKWHQENNTAVSGQIIYSNTGTQFFPFIKEYLVREVGYLDNEVEILTGETPQAKRERIKEGFQDNSIKIVIGSSAIREGMDLQNHCSVIYVLYLDWNPTDLHQLFGRGWRFGNKFSHVRMVIPVVENSSDIFTWQKLSEKMSRLNSIWSRTGVTKMFEEGELNAEELKRGLITDPSQLAEFEIKEELAFVENRLTVLRADAQEVRQALDFQAKIQKLEQQLVAQLLEMDGFMPPSWWKTSTDKSTREKIDRLAEIQAMPADMGNIKTVYHKIRTMSRFLSNNYIGHFTPIEKVDEHIKAAKSLKRVQETVLAAYQLPLDRLPEAETRIAEQIEVVEADIEKLKSDDYFQFALQRAIEQKEAEAATRRTVDDRVADFARLNYLLDCKFGVDMCNLYGRARSENADAPISVGGGIGVPLRKPTTSTGSAATDNASPIGEAISALRIALEFTETETAQQELREAIEALEVAMEFA